MPKRGDSWRSGGLNSIAGVYPLQVSKNYLIFVECDYLDITGHSAVEALLECMDRRQSIMGEGKSKHK